jgi:hypothetical protein
MQYVLLEKFYALERENESLKKQIKALEIELEALKEKAALSKKIDSRHAEELIKQIEFNKNKI